MNRIFNDCPFSFTFATGAGCYYGTHTGTFAHTTTYTGSSCTAKYCIYCSKQTGIICEKGACKYCHEKNYCHGELKK